MEITELKNQIQLFTDIETSIRAADLETATLLATGARKCLEREMNELIESSANSAVGEV